MDSLPQIPGIYMIVCQYSHKIYIGSSNNVLRRWKEHRKRLRSNSHENGHLMSAWRKYGECSFRCIFIEDVSQNELINREKFWLDTLKPFGDNGYNICENPEEPPMKGKKHTEDALRKIAITSKGRKGGMKGKTQSESAKQKLREFNLGRKDSEETRKKKSESTKGRKLSASHIGFLRQRLKNKNICTTKNYIITTPLGEEIAVHGLKDFCEKHNLNRSSMYNVAAGRRLECKGYKCRYA